MPQEIIEELGIDTFKYESFEVESFEPVSFAVDTFEPDKLDIVCLRRGVIGVSKIGFLY